MDQDTVVNEQTESGRRLIEALAATGFEVRVAFWAKPTEAGKWYLYLGSPFVDDQGPRAGYLYILDVLRKSPDVWIDPFDVKVLGMNDPRAQAALAVLQPPTPHSPYAARNPRPYPAMTPYNASTLGGLAIDGALIYPTTQTSATA